MLRTMDAFEGLVPVSDAYAHLPVAEAFDWSDVAAQLGSGEWYLVAFRSIRRGGCDEARLCDLDERAHQEAASSPGFVFYYKGPLASDLSCLSFCMWTSRGEARAAAGRPNHVTAVSVLDASGFASDGFHGSELGYRAWAAHVVEAVLGGTGEARRQGG